MMINNRPKSKCNSKMNQDIILNDILNYSDQNLFGLRDVKIRTHSREGSNFRNLLSKDCGNSSLFNSNKTKNKSKVVNSNKHELRNNCRTTVANYLKNNPIINRHKELTKGNQRGV